MVPRVLVPLVLREVPTVGLIGAQCRTPEATAAALMAHRFEMLGGCLLSESPVEAFGVALLSTKNVAFRAQVIALGSLQSCVVHAREVFRPAVAQPTAGIILFHNHPSGDPTPSPEDHAVTTKLVAGGALLDIPVLDHFIIGGDRYYSFRQSGTL